MDILLNLNFDILLIVNLIVGICVFAIFLAIFFNFIDDNYEGHKNPKKEKRVL